jgi:hypothetical protein
MVTKEHFDQVDRTIQSLENKADAIISDQIYQRQRQRNHQKEQEKFSSSFVLVVAIQLVFIIGTVLYQVLALRRFFV